MIRLSFQLWEYRWNGDVIIAVVIAFKQLPILARKTCFPATICNCLNFDFICISVGCSGHLSASRGFVNGTVGKMLPPMTRWSNKTLWIALRARSRWPIDGPVFSGLILAFKSRILTWRMVLYTFRELYNTIRKDERIVICCSVGCGRWIFCPSSWPLPR